MKNYLSLLLLAGWALVGFAGEVCVHVQWIPHRAFNSVAPGNIGTPESSSFCELNGVHPTRYSPLPSERFRNWMSMNGAMECFPQSAIKLNNNFLYCGYWINVKAPSEAIDGDFYLSQGSLACRAEFSQYSHRPGSVTAFAGGACTIYLPFSRLQPDDYSFWTSLLDEGEQLDKELEALRQETPKAEALRRQLEQILTQDFDSLTPETLAALGGQFTELAQNVRALKTDIETLRQQLRTEIDRTAHRIGELHDAVTAGLDEAPAVSTVPNGVLPAIPVLPSIALPQIPAVGSAGAFDPDHNAYTALAESTLEQLRAALAAQDHSKFNAILEAWTTNTAFVAAGLDGRAGSTLTAELRAFNQSCKIVLAFADKYIDTYGFFKDVGLPDDVRKAIAVDLHALSPAKARRLRDALNNWPPLAQQKPEHKLVLQTILGLSHGVKANRQTGNFVEVVQQLLHLLDEVTDAALSVSRFAVSFTPLAGFVDFCELVTGHQFCVPSGRTLSATERALSGVGALWASGRLWHALGEQSSESVVKQATRRAERIAEAAAEVHPKLGNKWVIDLPDLKTYNPGYFSEFEGHIHDRWTLEPGEIYFQAQRTGQKTPGRWFTPIRPKNPQHAEEMLNIAKYGNDAGQLAVFRVTERVNVYFGKVRDHNGLQIYLLHEIPLNEVMEQIPLDQIPLE